MIARTIAWVGLVVTDVAGAARAFGQDFGLPRTDLAADAGPSVPAFTLGDGALALFAPDHPFVGGSARPGVHHVAFAVPDVAAAAREAASAGIPASGPLRAGLGGRRMLPLDHAAACGVRMLLSEPVDLAPRRAGFVERIDHIGVASEDNAAAVALFVRRLGCPLESTQTDLEVRLAVESFTSDTYGVVYHTRPPEPVGGLRVTFVTTGDCELEFLEDFDPRLDPSIAHGQPGNTKQDQSAIARFVASRGAGLHHIALKVTDIDAALTALAQAGQHVIDRVGRPGSRRARIGFLHPKGLHGVLMHLVER